MARKMMKGNRIKMEEKNNIKKEEAEELVVINHKSTYLIQMSDEDGKPLVSIGLDGRVVIHQKNCEDEAAKVFYESLQIQGMSLFEKIDELEEENAKLKKRLNSKKT